jgi:hypothetical protein
LPEEWYPGKFIEKITKGRLESSAEKQSPKESQIVVDGRLIVTIRKGTPPTDFYFPPYLTGRVTKHELPYYTVYEVTLPKE